MIGALAQTLIAIGFYTGLAVLALLAVLVLVAPWWDDRADAAEADALTQKDAGRG